MPFKYQPQWQGPLSGRSFEKQTEDFLNGIESRVDEIDTRQTPSDAIPMAPGVGSAGTSDEYSRGDHSHPLQTDVSGHAGTASRLETARTISMSGEGSGIAAFDGASDISIPLLVSCTATGSVEQRAISDRFADVVNVKDFGAAGDGSADDTGALMLAVASGQPLFFPAGTYKASDSFVPNFKRYGMGSMSYSFQDIGDCFVTSNPARENLLCIPKTYQCEAQNHPYAFVIGDNLGDNSYNVLYCTGFDLDNGLGNVFKNTAFGSCIGKRPISWSLNTAVGHGVMTYTDYATRTTAVGSETCIWLGISSVQRCRDTWHPYWHSYEPGSADWDVDGLETLFPGVGQQIADFVDYAQSKEDIYGNTAIGRDVFVECVSGSYNTAVGYLAGGRLYSGSSNTLVGMNACGKAVFFDHCVAIGKGAGRELNNAYGTVCIGSESGASLQEMMYGVFIGYSAATSYTPPSGKKTRVVWIGGNTPETPVYSGYENNAGIHILPEDIRAPFHIKGGTSGSSLNPTTGGHLLVEGGNYSGVVLESNSTGIGFVAFANPSGGAMGMLQYSHQNVNFTFRLNNSNVLRINSAGSPYPETSGAANLGRSDKLWGTVYAQTGTINTSDEREKANIEDLSEAEAVLRAWGKVGYKVFQYRDSMAKKGEGARLHVGVIAQDVASAFDSEGLDAGRYGLFCYDEWGDEYEDREVVDANAVYNEDGLLEVPEKNHIEKHQISSAGNRYGIRYDEALALECAYLRSRISKLESRMAAMVEV